MAGIHFHYPNLFFHVFTSYIYVLPQPNAKILIPLLKLIRPVILFSSKSGTFLGGEREIFTIAHKHVQLKCQVPYTTPTHK